MAAFLDSPFAVEVVGHNIYQGKLVVPNVRHMHVEVDEDECSEVADAAGA